MQSAGVSSTRCNCGEVGVGWSIGLAYPVASPADNCLVGLQSTAVVATGADTLVVNSAWGNRLINDNAVHVLIEPPAGEGPVNRHSAAVELAEADVGRLQVATANHCSKTDSSWACEAVLADPRPPATANRAVGLAKVVVTPAVNRVISCDRTCVIAADSNCREVAAQRCQALAI